MTKLAIGVTIDPASAGPQTARFIYAYDPKVTSPRYLDNDKGDITLQNGKGAVEIQFRLMQEAVKLANDKSYALSLPASGALHIEGPVKGKWPDQFNQPVQGGEPGKPPSVVVVIDRNEDTELYKYTLSVVFTPREGSSEKKGDDPKIRNGGDVHRSGGLWSLRQVAITVLALIVGFAAGWLLRSG